MDDRALRDNDETLRECEQQSNRKEKLLNEREELLNERERLLDTGEMILKGREESLNIRDEVLNERDRLLNKLEKQLEDYEEQIVESETEISDKAYRKGFNKGVLGLTMELMDLFSETRVKEYGEDIPIKAVTLFIMTYSAGLLAASQTDDIDKLGNTFIDNIGKVIEDFEATL